MVSKSDIQNLEPALAPAKASLSQTGLRTKEQILEAAESLFAEKGFKATTLKDVSNKCAANTALISYYFGSKEGLRDAVLTRQLDRAGCRILKARVQETNPISLDEFRELLEIHFQGIEEDNTVFRLIVWSMADGGEISQKMAELMWKPFIEANMKTLEHLSQGKFSAPELQMRCLLLMGQLHQYAILKWNSLDNIPTHEPKDEFLKRWRGFIVKQLLDTLLRE